MNVKRINLSNLFKNKKSNRLNTRIMIAHSGFQKEFVVINKDIEKTELKYDFKGKTIEKALKKAGLLLKGHN